MAFSRSEKAKEYRKLYNSAAWQRLRAHHLAINPLCVMCRREGRTTMATVADHRTPHKGDLRLFFDPLNLDGLCQEHHSADKQQIEKRGYSTRIGPDGFPTDENHPAMKS